MKNFFIGILIGVGKIIPGVSGSVIAIRLNVYEKIILSLKYFFKDIKKNTIFLSSIFSGILLSIVLLSKIILYLYTNYQFPIKILFALLIISGIKDIYKKNNNYLLTIIAFLISILLIKIPYKYSINYFGMGIIESISMIVPGISGTAIFVSLGVYQNVLNLFIKINIINISLFSLGFILASIMMINLISYLFKRYKKETYSLILGFLLSSIILMFI